MYNLHEIHDTKLYIHGSLYISVSEFHVTDLTHSFISALTNTNKQTNKQPLISSPSHQYAVVLPTVQGIHCRTHPGEQVDCVEMVPLDHLDS